MESAAHFSELRMAYDEAFDRLRRETRVFEATEQEWIGQLFVTQNERVRQAECEYRRSRDELASFLLERKLARSDFAEHACVSA